jgi:hypothetical protein
MSQRAETVAMRPRWERGRRQLMCGMGLSYFCIAAPGAALAVRAWPRMQMTRSSAWNGGDRFQTEDLEKRSTRVSHQIKTATSLL